ncbi:sigma-54-dependent Fis family transcriptional regulator [candidate division KSB1 bacterium]|nr:sigma-54-dependent Fis family transcriptional regulator [candidate division KSB1 bacterium]
MKSSVLIVEPDDSILKLARKSLNGYDCELVAVDDLSHGVHLLNDLKSIKGIILDYDFLKPTIKEVIEEIKIPNEEIFVILIGRATTDQVIQCIKYGADEFIERPTDSIETFKRTLHAYLEKIQEKGNQCRRFMEQASRLQFQLIGKSKAIAELKNSIYKVAPLDSTILILGETGTGKEVVARLIHSLSPQKNENFIAVHCGGIPDTLLESTLFGHEKGSFTGAYRTHKGYFESAENGTIFLDEIGDTSPSFQVKLLRVLQEKEFRRIGGSEMMTSNARVIAATNRNLKELVKKGTFREDLFYRLNVITLRVASLRERIEDIDLLVQHFINLYSKKHNHLGVYLKPQTIEILKRQPWKGNVRELENVIERMIALSESDWIGPSELPTEYLQNRQIDPIGSDHVLPYAEAKNSFEREYVRRLLLRVGGNVSQAAKIARMPRQNLHLKIKKHGLQARRPMRCSQLIP